MRKNTLLKLLVFVLLCLNILSLLVGCQQTTTTNDDHIETLFDQFVVIEKNPDTNKGLLYIAYDKDTMVEYYIVISRYQSEISPVYEADGSLKIYNSEN